MATTLLSLFAVLLTAARPSAPSPSGAPTALRSADHWDNLLRATEAGDLETAGRALERLGPGPAALALRQARAGHAAAEPRARAVLLTARGRDWSSWLLRDALALVDHPDGALAQAALRLSAHVLADDPRALDESGTTRVLEGALAQACARALAVARDTQRALDLRLTALQWLAQPNAACAVPRATLLQLGTNDPDPLLRRLALQLPAPPADALALATAALDDAEPRVALAAAAQRCNQGRLDEPAVRARLHALAERFACSVDDGADDLIVLLECLGARDPEGAATAIARARTSPHPPVRDAARALRAGP